MGERSGDLVAGRYRLTTLIGVGGMAKVYRAHDELLARDVAVKVFDSSLDPDSPERFRAEMRTLARLAHPRLVALYDAGSETTDLQLERRFLVMELIDGCTLADRLRNGPLAPEVVRDMGEGLAAALAYVHSRGIVHRDIKPANILLEPSGAPHLADFGIASAHGDAVATQTGVALGTAPYLSPEQVRGAPAQPASDVYALGLVLLEALTGRREYAGHGLESALARLSRPPRIDALLGDRWTQLLRSMTADDPADRPSARRVAGALHTGDSTWDDTEAATTEHLLGAVLEADSVRMSHEAAPRRRRGRSLLVAGLAIAVPTAAVGSAVVFATHGQPTPSPSSPSSSGSHVSQANSPSLGNGADPAVGLASPAADAAAAGATTSPGSSPGVVAVAAQAPTTAGPVASPTTVDAVAPVGSRVADPKAQPKKPPGKPAAPPGKPRKAP